jgi:hypothetical protein
MSSRSLPASERDTTDHSGQAQVDQAELFRQVLRLRVSSSGKERRKRKGHVFVSDRPLLRLVACLPACQRVLTDVLAQSAGLGTRYHKRHDSPNSCTRKRSFGASASRSSGAIPTGAASESLPACQRVLTDVLAQSAGLGTRYHRTHLLLHRPEVSANVS